MNWGFFAKVLVATTAAALILFGLSGVLAQSGVPGAALLSDVWRLVALSIGVSIVSALAYPHVRGVRKGDSMVAFMRREAAGPAFLDVVLVTALSDGRMGEKVKIVFANGVQAEGRVNAYAGTFSPATLKITETERISPDGY